MENKAIKQWGGGAPVSEVEHGQVIHCQQVADLGSLGEQLGGLMAAGLGAPAVEVHHAQVEPGVHVALTNIPWVIRVPYATAAQGKSLIRATPLHDRKGCVRWNAAPQELVMRIASVLSAASQSHTSPVHYYCWWSRHDTAVHLSQLQQHQQPNVLASYVWESWQWIRDLNLLFTICAPEVTICEV